MKRILVRLPIVRSGEYDIFQKTDFSKLSEMLPYRYGNACPNLGNRLWFQGIISAITTHENIVEFSDESFLCDQINANYDLVVAPMANIFSEFFCDDLNRIAALYEQIKIPVFVIACGAQAASYDDLKRLCEAIREPASRFIKAILNTGGEFALRGHFTKELFTMLGFPSVGVVTGCPSLFQLGRDLSISNEKVHTSALKPIFNGTPKQYHKALSQMPDSIFVDQEAMYKLIYDDKYIANLDYRELKTFQQLYGLQSAKHLLENRIKLIPDMNEWRNFFINNGYNYSFGGRIHGNIMSILSGIPATVVIHDTRTREMAEFFDIPIANVKKGSYTQQDICEYYLQADYTAFNKSFASKYDDFEQFLIKCGLVSKINANNTFFDKTEAVSFEQHLNDQQELKRFYYKLLCSYPIILTERIYNHAKRAISHQEYRLISKGK